MLEYAKAFFEMVLPCAATAPGTPPFLNVHWKTVKADGKIFWNGRACASSDEMVSNAGWVARSTDLNDLYFCVSSQSRAERKIAKTSGKPYLNAVRFANSAVALKSIFVDIDVKEKKGYPSQAEALAALQDFMAKTGMPMPSAVVGSGSGGFHVYWSFLEPITVTRWQPLAQALVRAVLAEGLICDTQCTIDAARILRIPGTLNHKTNPPNNVVLMSLGAAHDIGLIEQVLSKYDQFVAAGAQLQGTPFETGVTPVGNGGANDELTGGIVREAAPIDIQNVAKNCAFVKHALDTGGVDFDNNYWFLATSIASYTTDPENNAHTMANGHPDYGNGDKTQDMYERVMRSRSGWPQCEKIILGGFAGCSGCKFAALKKSPLNFSRDPDATPEAQTVDVPAEGSDGQATPTVVGELPPGYFYNADGRISLKRFDQGTGQTFSVDVLEYPMVDAWLQDNPWVLHFTTVIHGNRRTKIEAPLAELGAKDGVTKVFARQGMLLKDKAGVTLREFLVSWIRKLQDSKNAVVSSTPFGWAVDHGKVEGFTYAGKVWGDNTSRSASAPDPVLTAQYTPKGSLEPWLAAAEIITGQRRPELDAILAASFGAPLVRFTGQPGAMLSAYSSESGIGKTTTMRVAQAVWGDPIKAMQSLSDTPNSVLKKIGDIKALPLFWDELKTEQDTNRFAVLSFQLTQGKEKSRLNADVSYRDPGTWQTMLVSASNDSLVDPITKVTKSTTAGLYRLFEYAVPPGKNGQVEQGVVSRAVGLLNDNFGHAGLIYAQFLGANHERIEREVAAIQDAIVKGVNAGNDERFWIVVITTVLAGAKYANELGLTKINVKELKKFLLGVLFSMRKEVVAAPNDMKNVMSVSNILAQFINAMRARNTLFTNKIHTGQGKPAKGAIQIKLDTSRLDAVYVQIGLEDRLMRVSSTYFSQWLTDHQYSRYAVVKALKDEFNVKNINGKLGSGTERAAPMEYLLEIDMNDPKLAGFIE